MNKLGLVFLLPLVLMGGCSRNYSDGFRLGVIRKFSHRGLIVKSWEGELLLGGVVSTGGKDSQLVNETWDFSVDPDHEHGENVEAIITALTHAAESGCRTKVYYVEDTTIKMRTSTDYLVQKVEIVQDGCK